MLYFGNRATSASGSSSPGFAPLLCLAGVFFCILGSKLHMIYAFGSDVPFWDQWDYTGKLYPAVARGTLAPFRLIAAHGEHRVLFARLFALTLIKLNGQWDPLVEMTVNAILFSLMMTGLCLVLWRLAGREYLPVFCIAIATIGVLQFNWENVLWGGSCSPFLIGFAILSILLLVCSRPFSFSWFLGFLAALFGQFTAATGFLAPVAVASMLFIFCLSGNRSFKESFPALAVLVAFSFLESLIRGPFIEQASHQAFFQNLDLIRFFTGTAKAAAWPFRVWPLAFLVWLPFLLLIRRLFGKGVRGQDPLLQDCGRSQSREGFPDVPGERGAPFANRTSLAPFLAALGIWALLQAAAIGFARGASASRYRDMHSIGLLANIVILLFLIAGSNLLSNRIVWYRRAVWTGTAVLIACIAMSVTHFKTSALILERCRLSKIQEVNTARYILTGDAASLTDKPDMHIPYPAADGLIYALSDADLLEILPASIRKPLAIEPIESGGFAQSAIPPSFDSLPHRPVVGSWGTEKGSSQAVYLSQSVSTRFGWLIFDVAGAGPGASLEILPSNGEAISVSPVLQSDGWRRLTVRAPEGPFKLKATSEGPDGWIAFSLPRELASGGYYVRLLCSENFVLIGFGLINLIVGLIICMRNGRSLQPTEP
jgi:hypothetical protein